MVLASLLVSLVILPSWEMFVFPKLGSPLSKGPDFWASTDLCRPDRI